MEEGENEMLRVRKVGGRRGVFIDVERGKGRGGGTRKVTQKN